MSSDQAGSAAPAPTARPVATGAAPAAALPVTTVSAATTNTTNAAAGRSTGLAVTGPAADAMAAPSLPLMRRPPVIAAAARAASIEDVAPPTPNSTVQPPAPLPLLRMVCWEVAVMIGLLAIGRPWLEAGLVCAGAAVLLAVTAIWFRGNWVSTFLLRWISLLVRRRARDLAAENDRQAVLLDFLVPGGKVTANELGGVAAGTLSRREGLTAVLRPVDTGVRELVHAVLSGAVRAGNDEAGPEQELQVVLHRGPQGGGQAQPRAWLAIRAVREVDVLDDDDLRIALSNMLRRVQRRLRGDGLSVALLSEREIQSTVTALTHVGQGRELLRERWRAFYAGTITQIGLCVTGLSDVPPQHRSTALERLVAAVPWAAVTAGVTTGDGDPVVVLRVAAPTGAVADGTVDQLTRVALSLGLRLERLDGLHARAVAASLPLGGVSL